MNRKRCIACGPKVCIASACKQRKALSCKNHNILYCIVMQSRRCRGPSWGKETPKIGFKVGCTASELLDYPNFNI